MKAMSGSYDRPGGRRNTLPSAAGFDPFDDILTGPSTGSGQQRYHYGPTTETHHEPTHRPNYRAPIRAMTKRKARQPTSTPVVPPDTVTGRSLTLVVSIMCFLACLTAGAVYMINESANAWLKDIASEVTVQIEPQENVDTAKTVQAVEAFLQGQKGIARAQALSLDETGKLLEPWLGQSDLLSALPVPRLIAVEVDRQYPPDIADLRAELGKRFKGVTLDDHRHWQRQIRTVTRSFALGGLAILLLVAAATTAIIVSATRSSMASNREIVEVLHFVGATDRFIAREFEKHFLRLGIRAGLVGAACAMVVFLSMRAVMELLGGGDITVAEMHRLIGTGGLDVAGYLLLGAVVIIIAALCMLTSRFGVFRILNAKP
jgi:cell division transport system permease protein